MAGSKCMLTLGKVNFVSYETVNAPNSQRWVHTDVRLTLRFVKLSFKSFQTRNVLYFILFFIDIATRTEAAAENIY